MLHDAHRARIIRRKYVHLPGKHEMSTQGWINVSQRSCEKKPSVLVTPSEHEPLKQWCLMLVQRRRRWANIIAALGQGLVFDGPLTSIEWLDKHKLAERMLNRRHRRRPSIESMITLIKNVILANAWRMIRKYMVNVSSRWKFQRM